MYNIKMLYLNKEILFHKLENSLNQHYSIYTDEQPYNVKQILKFENV